MQDFRTTCTLAPHCSLIRSVHAGVGWTVSLVGLPCLLVQQRRRMLLVWGDLWAVYKRGRVWCLIVRETYEYHSRGEEYIWCYFGETCGYHSKLDGYGVCPGEACLCQLLTDNLLRVIIYWKKVHYACQKQCHVCLDSHLTKPYL